MIVKYFQDLSQNIHTDVTLVAEKGEKIG
jgi:hypothetical protein